LKVAAAAAVAAAEVEADVEVAASTGIWDEDAIDMVGYESEWREVMVRWTRVDVESGEIDATSSCMSGVTGLQGCGWVIPTFFHYNVSGTEVNGKEGKGRKVKGDIIIIIILIVISYTVVIIINVLHIITTAESVIIQSMD
jgi:hypothetical protein